MTTKKVAKRATWIAWCLALAAFVFSWFHAPFDNDPLQSASIFIVAAAIALALLITLLSPLAFDLAEKGLSLSVRELPVGACLIAGGVAILVFCPDSGNTWTVLTPLGFPLIGAGIFSPLKRPWHGAAIVFLLMIIIVSVGGALGALEH